ncbi:MAG: DivIVA domain-containing protein [Lachnospiraceae bacterium]|nr:DivIVA domain-containing protein [Lachnospiraceae bacterium]
MLTPVEIQNTKFKSAASGYNKGQVDKFMEELNKDYEFLYRQNLDMTEKISSLNDRVQYYITIEKSLHKALVLAEKSAEETKAAAMRDAKAIEKQALADAQEIRNNAEKELSKLHTQTLRLMQQYETYRAQCQALLDSQKEILDSRVFQINVKEFEAYTEYLQSMPKDKDKEKDDNAKS